MALFNQKAQPVVPDTTNLAGGAAFAQSPKLALVSKVLTALVQDTYYKSQGNLISELGEQAKACDHLFLAQLALYARKQNNLRSVSHILAGELAMRKDLGSPTVNEGGWVRRFYKQVALRPDDILETLAYMKGHGCPDLRALPNSLKRGFGDALTQFDAYQIAKYQRKEYKPNLVDAVNLLHPVKTEALTALMTGTLKPANTWENKLQAIGRESEGKTEQHVADLKADAWMELLQSKKLGYMACLRNLRNIAEQAPDAMPLALEFLQNPHAVERSRVIPFQFVTAVEAIKGTKAMTTQVRIALDTAMNLSLKNMPVFPGKTLIAVDVSGSMRGNNGRPIAIASLFAGVLFKSQPDADIMLFDGHARYLDLMPNDSLTTICGSIINLATGGSTNFSLIFECAKHAYDRIIILSDMQAWGVGGSVIGRLKDYRSRMQANPKIYTFDLCGSGTMQFPENNVYALAGFSDGVLSLMQNLERDPQALIHEIEAIQI